MRGPDIRRRAFWWRAAIGASALAILLWAVDWSRFAAAMRVADPWWLVAVLAVIHADKVWMACKWLLLARGSGLSTTVGDAVKAYYISSFWGSLLPASVGGDVIRISWLTRKGQEVSTVAWSVVVERVLGALAQAVTGLAALIVLAGSERVAGPAVTGAFFVFGATAAIAVIVVFSQSAYDVAGRLAAWFRWAPLERAVAKTKLVVLGYRQRRALLLTFLALSVLEQAFPVVSTFALARAFSIDLPLRWLVIGVPIILAVSRLPLSLHDYGIKEGAYAVVLSFAGLSLTESVMIAMVDRILVLVAMLPGAFWTVSARATSAAPSKRVTALAP
jgi:glycosyltransferase 2 family protein